MAKKSLSRLINILKGAGTHGADGPLLETSISRLEKFAHFWVLVWGSFVRNRCPVRASALSYTTLLALIPMLAVTMSVTSMFLKSEGKEQIEQFIQQFVDRMVPPAVFGTNVADSASDTDLTGANPGEVLSTNETAVVLAGSTNAPSSATPTNGTDGAGQVSAPPAVRDQRVVTAQKEAARYIHGFIQNTYTGTLGVTGMVFLLLTAILMLTRVEETFNDIWGVGRGRNWLARVVQYWATLTLGPLLLVGAVVLASGPNFLKTRELINTVPYLEPVISQLLPLVVICFTFAMFYKLVPNTKVHFSAAVVGGALAGTLWHLYNLLAVVLVSRAVNASKIYGSLALVPLFMGGLYMVWLTVLFGAQVAYAFQNRAAYLQDKLAENVNQRGREFVALRLMTCVGQRFQRGLPPATILQISSELGIPSRLAQQVLQTLLAARLVAEVSGAEPAYAPARPLEAINAHHILLAMRATHGQELVTRDEPSRAEVYGEFARIQEAERQAASSVTMLALVNRAQARLEIAPRTDEAKPIEMVAMLVTPVAESSSSSKDREEESRTRTKDEDEIKEPPVTAEEATVAAAPVPETKKEAAVVETVKPTTIAETQTASATAEPSTDDERGFPL